MGSFDTIQPNTFPTEPAQRAWAGVFVLFLLWWVSLLIHNLLTGLFRPLHDNLSHNNGTTTLTTNHPGSDGNILPAHTSSALGTTGTRRARLERHTYTTTNALQVQFLSAFVVTTVNHLVNGISKGFMALMWVQVIVGFMWAVGRGSSRFGRFADAWLLVIIPVFVAMWALAFRDWTARV